MKEQTLTTKEISSLCETLSHLIHAGISEADALHILAQEEPLQYQKDILTEMAGKADRGQSLASVFHESRRFPPYVCALLEVGRQTGKTEETLSALGQYYEERARMDRTLRRALLYPTALFSVLLAVMVVLLIWVLPIFDDVYAQLGSHLTGLAGGLLALGAALKELLPVFAVLFALVAPVLAIPPLRRKVITSLQHLWGDRGVMKGANNARFIQALSMALSSGMDNGESARLATSISQGDAPRFLRRCEECTALLEQGSTLANALEKARFLAPGDARLLEAGRRSGRSEAVLAHLSQRLTRESEEDLQQAPEKLEPALIIIACVLIGVVLLSVLLPLMNIMNAIG